MHVIAAKAVCFEEALHDEFKQYQHQVRLNAAALADEFRKLGVNMVSDGTDNHLILVDLTGHEKTGKDMEELLGKANITVNKNTVPGEQRSPFVTSGIRLGTPAVTTRGFKEENMRQIAHWFKRILDEGEQAVPEVKQEVLELMKSFPLYE